MGGETTTEPVTSATIHALSAENVPTTASPINEQPPILASSGSDAKSKSQLSEGEMVTIPLGKASSSALGKSKKETLEEKINRMLIACGIPDPETKSRCLRVGLAKGFYDFKGEVDDLNKIVWSGKCYNCRAPASATVRTLLEQPDEGSDYSHHGSNAPNKCSKADCGTGIYVTRMCEGRPERDGGRFHGHCTTCPNLGVCTRNCYNAHCEKCGEHYFAGEGGGEACPCTSKKPLACCTTM